MPGWAGKIDCIFIDPPYNTGQEGWCYNDNVNSPMLREWFEKTVGLEDGLRHDKWCAMMWPRLRLLQELLSESGSIWVTIDDNESHYLKALMDEIFGRRNFISNIVWQHRKSTQNDTDVSLSHNHILTYAKNIKCFKLNRRPAKPEEFDNPDNDPRGPWVADSFEAPHIRPNLTYPIQNPLTGEQHLPSGGRHWRMTREKFSSALADNRIVWGKRGKGKPQMKRFLSEAEERGKSIPTLWDDVDTATQATRDLMKMFDSKEVFPTPKPVRLIERILEIATHKNSVVLDSFAGSGTTAQAVLELNQKDGGDRRFILVEMEDYANTITAERVRRVINGYEFMGTQSKRKIKEKIGGLGGSFTYCQLGEEVRLKEILSGENLPPYESLVGLVFNMATNTAFDPHAMREQDFYLGKSRSGEHVWMIYKPDIDFLKSPEAALTLDKAREIQKTDPDARHLVVGPIRFVSRSMLEKSGVKVDFVPLPFMLYRADRS